MDVIRNFGEEDRINFFLGANLSTSVRVRKRDIVDSDGDGGRHSGTNLDQILIDESTNNYIAILEDFAGTLTSGNFNVAIDSVIVEAVAPVIL